MISSARSVVENGVAKDEVRGWKEYQAWQLGSTVGELGGKMI